MHPVLVFEPEELLFDTLELRATALHSALAREGVEVELSAVRLAHAGVPAATALDRLRGAEALDATGTALVLRRAADVTSSAFAVEPLTFSVTVRDRLAALAGQAALAVVTRGSRADAQQLLSVAGIDAEVRCIRSMADLDPGEYHSAWSDAVRGARGSPGVAFAPPGVLDDARRAALAGSSDIDELTDLLDVARSRAYRS